jgi:hypothetical protein
MFGNIQRLIQLLIITTSKFIEIRIIIIKGIYGTKIEQLAELNPWLTH